MFLARIRVSGELAGLLLYIGIVGIIGGVLTWISNIIRKLVTKNNQGANKVFDWIDRLIWLTVIVLAVLDIFAIFPTISWLLDYLAKM